MTNTSSYAKALFELAFEKNICDMIKNELEEIRDVIRKCSVHLFFSLVDAYKKACGTQHVTAVTAVAMTADEKQKLETVLRKKRKKEIELENEVDPSILGGIILRFSDSQTDASLKGRLEKAKYDLHKEKKYGY